MVSSAYLLNVFLMFVRILAVFMTAPIFSSRNVPTIGKIGFAGLLSIILLPFGTPDAKLIQMPDGLGPFVLSVAQEVLVGTLIGFVSNLVFVAVGMGAGMMGLQVGFRAANLFNPLFNVSSAALDQFYSLVAAALFLAIDGHHWLILALVRTFQVIPLGTFVFNSITADRLIVLSSETFVAAVRIALPVVSVLLLTDLGLGLVARAVPQVQIFFLSLPLKIGLGLLVLALTLTITLPMVKDFLANTVGNVVALGFQ